MLGLLSILISVTVFARIEDNSFLLEEAFNQPPGVYQFIQTFQSDLSRGKDFLATEGEAPLGSTTHQASYQVSDTKYTPEGVVNGDLTLNYRWQPWNDGKNMWANRFGLILPKEMDDVGYLWMQAWTFTLGEKWMHHWNLGLNTTPNAKFSGPKRKALNGTTLGTSFIYMWKENANFLMEALWENQDQFTKVGEVRRQSYLSLSPGMRFELKVKGWERTQIVPGLAFPFTYHASKMATGVFIHLSLEPNFN